MQPGSDLDYRRLEHHYHHSAEYAAMVERYPLLRRSIADTRGARLEGHPATGLRTDESSVVLQWDRSHGEH